MHHLNKKLDRKSSQSFSLSTRQFVSPGCLVNQGVVVLFIPKKKLDYYIQTQQSEKD